MFFTQFLENTNGASFTRRVFEDENPLGGTKKRRIIYEPNKEMRQIHGRFLLWLREDLGILLPSATASLPGSSRIGHIKRHSRYDSERRRFFPRFLYATDIKDAYPSIKTDNLAEVLTWIGWQRGYASEFTKKQMAVFLRVYFTSREGGLPVGGPASQDLCNIYFEVVLDQPLRTIAKQYNLKYTRYLDDLLFSSVRAHIGKRKRQRIRTVIECAGHFLNPKKTRVYDLKKGPALICGIRVHEGGRLTIPQHFMTKFRGALHRANRQDGSISEHVIDGMMSVVKEMTRDREPTRTEQKLIELYHIHKAELEFSGGPLDLSPVDFADDPF